MILLVILYFDHLTNGGNKKFFIQKEGEYIYCNTYERIVAIEKNIMILNCMTMRTLGLQIKYLFFFLIFLINYKSKYIYYKFIYE